ncbi:lipoate--protein ligase family protein [Enterococcus saccharolyticus]|uniref:Lipoate--protein ligase n=1 Tax=Candidatus Enterococcus willemsii TaxID=1857215 RepID=A0ABQ6Z1A3_9ENTE|nr:MULTISPECIES: lipoate--protein ligase family protein [Enterococcus]KAF1305152.1 lipoate--protein ligase [Enterococcus sp. CU12B]MCD5003526.1 lipoate--protein ligase family protein [Enterococcus saccharolyticus]
MKTLLFDQPIFTQQSAYVPFALTDVFTEHVSEKQQTIVHFWQFEQTFILGMKDTRVPYFTQGIQSIINDQYVPVIRNSGGLGVISDEGILNFSLIFPKDAQTTTDSAYEKMFALTQQAFPELTIEAYEITASYCPGTYDLSVNGKKIAGIAQRRLKSGVAVMMYLSVNGNQHVRGEVVQHFYQESLGEKFGTDGYPPVDPTCMVTVEELLGKPLSIAETKTRFVQALALEQETISPFEWLSDYQYTDLFEKKLASMHQRNSKIKEG